MEEGKSDVDEINPELDQIPETKKDEGQEERKQYPLEVKVRMFLMGSAATTFSFSLGNALGWSSPALQKLDALFGEIDQSWISSILPLGAAFACIYSGFLLEKLGSRFTMLVQVIPLLLGWTMLSIGGGLSVYLLGRFILGMAGGAICMSVPVYVNEISIPEIRGKMGALFQLSITFGIVHIYLVGRHASLSVLAGTSIIFPILAFVQVYFFLPDSPIFLFAKGKPDEAEKALKRLLKTETVDLELKEIAEFAGESNISLASTLKSKSGRKATMLILGLMFFQQFSGINVVIFYSAELFEVAKTGLSKYNCIIIVGIIQWLSTFLANELVDRRGRRSLMMISLIGITITQMDLAFYFSCPSNHTANWLPLFSVCSYLISYSLGAGPLPWSMMGELLPPSAKGSISSLAVTFNWLMAFLITATFYDMKSSIDNSFPFLLYASVSCIGVVVMYFFLPETKGRTLGEIKKTLGKDRIVKYYSQAERIDILE